MIDFIGNELHIGDEIVYVRSTSSGFDMYKTKIIGFTPRMLKVEKLGVWEKKEYSLAAPQNCVLYQRRV